MNKGNVEEARMSIGKIVKSTSHVTYSGHIYGAHETAVDLSPHMYTFGQFVRIALRSDQLSGEASGSTAQHYAIGIIYDTMLLNPSSRGLGPLLSNDTQTALFSPDYISEKATIISVLLLGTMEQRTPSGERTEVYSVVQGVPLFTPELGSEIETMIAEDVQRFHFFSNSNTRDAPSLHIDYLSSILTQKHSLLPMLILRVLEQLEHQFPTKSTILSIIKRNIAWHLKVESTS